MSTFLSILDITVYKFWCFPFADVVSHVMACYVWKSFGIPLMNVDPMFNVFWDTWAVNDYEFFGLLNDSNFVAYWRSKLSHCFYGFWGGWKEQTFSEFKLGLLASLILMELVLNTAPTPSSAVGLSTSLATDLWAQAATGLISFPFSFRCSLPDTWKKRK